MKRVLILLLVICSYLGGNAQSLFKYSLMDETFDNNEYSQIYLDSATTQKQKYDNAKVWIANTFGDYKSVLQFEDNERGKIIIKGFSELDDIIEFDDDRNKSQYSPILNFTLTIDCRNDKFRLKFENLSFHMDKVLTIALFERKSSFDISASDFVKMGDSFKRALSVELTSLLNSASKAIETNDDF